MIEVSDVFNINFYKKEKFHGSYKGMHYCIEKYTDEADETFLKVTTWPGPYNFDTTADHLKETAFFAFHNDGLKDTVDYLNHKWESDF